MSDERPPGRKSKRKAKASDWELTKRELGPGQLLFQRYTLVRVLGKGGMGVVWLALDGKLERHVALKFLTDQIIHDGAVLADLKRETRRCLELTHPHIVRIYDFVQDAHNACISMEFVDGETLSHIRAKRANNILETPDLEPWLADWCQAMHYAHTRARVVHCDLKPANLMVDSKGTLKVTDFGIARSLTESVSRFTEVRGKSGTLVYMSPQQLNGDPPSPMDDIYSMGATLYELLTSKPPFYRGQIDRQIFDRVPPSIAMRRAELDIKSQFVVPLHWEETIAGCLAKEPLDRPQGAAEIANRLSLMSSLQVQRLPPTPPRVVTEVKTLGDLRGIRPTQERRVSGSLLERARRAFWALWKPIVTLPLSALLMVGAATFATLCYFLATQAPTLSDATQQRTPHSSPSSVFGDVKPDTRSLQTPKPTAASAASPQTPPQRSPDTLPVATKAELDSMLSKAMRHFDTDNFAEALRELDSIDARQSDFPGSRNLRNVIELRQANVDRQAKTRALAARKYEQAQESFQQRDLVTALSLLDEVDTANPNQASTINLRGEILLAQGDFDGAESAFNRAAKLDPKMPDVQYNLAQVPFKRKEYTKARERLEALFASTPTSGSNKNQATQIIRFKIYLTLLLEGEDSRAQKMMEQFQFTGDTPALYYAQAAWEFKHNNTAKANEWIVAARKIYSPALNLVFADSFYDLGWLQKQAAVSAPTPTAVAKSSNGITREQIAAFTRNFVDSNGSSDIDATVAFYAPNAQIMQEGPKTVEAIRQDVKAYNERWPNRLNKIRGNINISERVTGREYSVTFDQEYYVENPTRREWIKGVVAVDLIVSVHSGELKISLIKQRSLSRAKGAL